MQSLYPVLKYEDASAALDFLEQAFGFERLAVHEGENGAIAHAEMKLGDEVVMFGSAGEGFVRVSAFNARERVHEAVERIRRAFAPATGV